MLIEPKIIRPLILDIFKHRYFVALSFLVISVSAAVGGLYWPKIYTSHATVFFEQKNILGPLMEGAAVQTGVQDQARIAQEIIFSRKIMQEILLGQGVLDESSTPKQVDDAIDNLKSRTRVSMSSPSLIAIDYRDHDAQRAFWTTKTLSEVFIRESTEAKVEESRAAFDFINNQVKEYEQKLQQSEERLKDFRADNEAIAPGAEQQARQRVQDLSGQIAGIEQELREAVIREQSLREQLTGEDKTAEKAAATSSIQVRISALREQLDQLRLTYHDTYPDIVQLREQIAELEAQKSTETGEGGVIVVTDAGGSSSVVLQQLQQNYYDTKILIATLESRLTRTREQLTAENSLLRQIPEAEARLKETSREYDVNQMIYNDLLRRREIARVSMNVDREKQGLTFKIHEPAFLPNTPGGPRMYQIALAGMLFGVGFPITFLGFVQRVDGKLRHSSQIPEDLDVPFFVTVPEMLKPSEVTRRKVSFFCRWVLHVYNSRYCYWDLLSQVVWKDIRWE